MEFKAISRRRFLGRAATLAIGAGTPLTMPFVMTGRAHAQAAANNNKFIAGMASDNGNQYLATNFQAVDPRWRRQMVQYFSDEPEGTVVVDTKHHYLYWIWENNTAIRYGVGVGKDGFQWFGRSRVARKTRWPRWVPPQEMRERHPELPEFMDAGPKNPLGPRALYLFDENGDTGYRLHGTVAPWSIGTNASSGCIRMFNEDAIDLYRRCPVGTAVLVLEHIADRAPVVEDS
jgi:lipoprotein-anchoring transpeptidase ErfK/SrfK